jgi:hypothetical protein
VAPQPVTLGTAGHKGGGLLCHKLLLQHSEELFRFCQGQAKVFDALAILVEDGEVRHSFFTIILCTHNELHLEFHGGHPPVRVMRIG